MGPLQPGRRKMHRVRRRRAVEHVVSSAAPLGSEQPSAYGYEERPPADVEVREREEALEADPPVRRQEARHQADGQERLDESGAPHRRFRRDAADGGGILQEEPRRTNGDDIDTPAVGGEAAYEAERALDGDARDRWEVECEHQQAPHDRSLSETLGCTPSTKSRNHTSRTRRAKTL